MNSLFFVRPALLRAQAAEAAVAARENGGAEGVADEGPAAAAGAAQLR